MLLLLTCNPNPIERVVTPQPMHRLLLLFISFLLPITAFWSTPSCQPDYYPCRCQRYNSCGTGSSPGTGYAVPTGSVGGGWAEQSLSPQPRIAKPRKFVFIWSDEEEETEERIRVAPEERVRPEGRTQMVIPPSIKRIKPPKDEESLDTAALLELNSSEIEKGRIKTSKSSKDEEDLWTDREKPSKGTVVTKGEEDLWKEGDAKSTNWSNSRPATAAVPSPMDTRMGGGNTMGGLEGGSGGMMQTGRGLGAGGYGGGGGGGGGGGFGGGRGGGSLFGISSGFGVTAPGVGPIGGGWGFGVGK